MARYVRSLLVVPALSTAAVFSSKLRLSVFRLQFVASYNWARRAPNLEYRLTTKWSDGARVRRKERFSVSPRCALACKWNLDAHFPDMEGCAAPPLPPPLTIRLLSGWTKSVALRCLVAFVFALCACVVLLA